MKNVNLCYLCGRKVDRRYGGTKQKSSGIYYHEGCDIENYLADCEGREAEFYK